MEIPILIVILAALTTRSICDRLPTGMDVSLYNLHLNFTQETFTRSPYEYEGYMQIRFALMQSYKSDVKLHAASDFIKVKSVVLEVNSTLTDITSFDIDKENNMLTLGGTEIANRNVYNSYLYIRYTSRLSVDDMYGLYKTTYTSNGKSSYMAASQFEPIFARRVFPCLDEPTYKTTLRLNVTYPPDMEVHFNTDEDDSVNATDIIDDDTSITTYFKSTGKMASYMAGLFVTFADDFTCSIGENFTSGTIDYYRICSRPQTEHARDWALKIGPSLMKELYNVTNYGYGLIMGFPKMELLAAPNMAAKATENWGVIAFREQDLLYDEDNSSILDKQNIAQTLTFEFAQMWFGNMASPEWWHYTYLTKGLAFYLQYFIPDRIFNDWDLNKQFVNRVLQQALELDSLRNAPNLQTGANSTEEIIGKFGKLPLFKGASLFRMLNEVIAGYASFRQGLEYFLTSYSYRNSMPQGMWNLISAQINLDNRARLPPNTYLKDALIDWEINPGFPLLEVARREGNVTVKQKGRFLYTGLDTSYEWYVPVSFVFSSNLTDFENTTINQYALPNSSFEIELPSQDEEWIILNRQAAGYYRVHYGDMWQNISNALHNSNFSGIPELNRAQLLNDVFALARAKIVKYQFVFDFLDYIVEEESLFPWITFMDGVNYILRRVGFATNLGLQIEGRVFPYLSKIYNAVPWSTLKEDDYPYTLKQTEILTGACKLGYLDCVKTALRQFEAFKSSGNRPNKNLRSIVYCTGLLYGSETSNWDVLWKAYETTDLAAERVKILSALGCTENEVLLQKSLTWSLNETSGIKSQDASIIFTSVYSNSKIGANVALQFLIDNHQNIAQRYQSMNSISNMVLGLAEHLTDNVHISLFRQFLLTTDNLAEEFKIVADQALEITDINVIWLDNHLDELKEYFQIDLDENMTQPTTSSVPTSNTADETKRTTPSVDEISPGKGNLISAPFVIISLSVFSFLSLK